jgi:4-hydroxy-tetrahydrodipicolinate reductase
VTRVAIIGAGKMARALVALAPDAGCEVVAQLVRTDTAKGITAAALNGAQVVIEFTAPKEAAKIVGECLALGVAVVSGTTGWDAERATVEAGVKASNGAFLWAPNFAIGVHLFTGVVADAARRFATAGESFSPRIIETHHTEKKDAPSGTAKLLAAVAEQAGGRAVPITSVRTGTVPGTHEVIFDAPFEQVRLVHEARDRNVFASGALAAARWLVDGRRTGVFTLDDFLGGKAR